MISRLYRFGHILPWVLLTFFTFAAMTAFQLLKHILWPDITIWGSHIDTILFVTAVAAVGAFGVYRELEARSLLACIVESSDDAIIGTTLDGIIVSWNRGAEKMYGYRAGEVVGKPVSILLPSDLPEDQSNIFDSVRRGGRVDHYETTRNRKDGKKVHVSLFVSPIFNAPGRIIGASAIARDITERKKAEDALWESQSMLEHSQAFSLVMSAHIGLDGCWIKVPPKLCELLGYSEAEMLARRSQDVTHPDDREEERKLCRDLIEGRMKSVDLEKRCLTKDGRILHIYLNYSIVTDIEGNPVHFLAYIRDITKRRMAEEELKQTNIYLENVLENSPDAIGIVDKHGKLIKWNKMAAELYGYSFEELRGKAGFSLFADRDELEIMLKDLRRQGSVEKREILIKRNDWSLAPSELSIGLLQDTEGRVLGSVSVARDLSEIKNALIELKASNERLSEEIIVRKLAEAEVKWLSRQNQLILDAAGEGIVGLDLAGRVTFINPAGAELAGYKVEELIQKEFHQVVHHSRPDGTPYSVQGCPMFESLHSGVARRERDDVFWRKDGTSFPVAYSSTPILEEGQIVGAVITFRDITLRRLALEELNRYRDRLEDLVKERTTELAMANEQLTCEIEERKRAEEALQERERKFRAIFDQTFQFMGLMTIDGRLIEANRTGLRFGGIQESDVIGKPFWQTPWLTHSTQLQEILRVAVAKAAAGECVRLEVTNLAADGSPHCMDFSLKPVMDEAGSVAFLIAEARDIHERKQAEEAVLKANRVINTLWECNNALMHVKDELQLLQEICRIIVEVGGYKMAWVGYVDDDVNQIVTPVAQHGYEDGYLDNVNITWKDTERGRGPTGTAVRTGVPSVVRQLEYQSSFDPWRKEALERGYDSVIALPLLVEGRILGCLTIYSAEPGVFDEDEVNLLSKLGVNLSFGIETLRISHACALAEIELQNAHDQLDQRVKERTAALEKANEQLQQIPSKLIAVLEEERKRLASELHDSIGQTLAAVKFWVEMALKLRDAGDNNAVLNHLEQFVPTLQRAIEETRSIYMGLRPSMLDSVGLLSTLEWLRQECMKLYPDRHVELETGVAEEEIPENLKVNIFRIAQEAMNNVAKHSQAEWVDISLSKNRGGIELAIADDGVGMNPAQILQTGADGTLGLTSMRERAELTGGSFSITSAPGKGTTIRACWPIQA
ncbi:MAG: PAS domain S-box protein [Syntrophobacteraceae bacterium]